MSSHSPWVIVLAGGSGSRLAAITTAADGTVVPKQYCSLRGGRSLLLEAIGRALQLVPRNRIVVVVAAEHERWWRPQLTGHAAENLLVQPGNCGTATGLLLAVASIRARDLHARIVVMPSDHHVERPAVLTAALRVALHHVEQDPQRLLLLGIRPEAPDTGYGYVVPGERHGRLYEVEQFVEKPELRHAESLLQRGALWHSFLIVADATVLWNLGRARQPRVTTMLLDTFELPEPERSAALRAAYATLPLVDFARDVLTGAEQRLMLLPVPRCGWTDLGTPQRLQLVLHKLGPGPERPAAHAGTFAALDLAAAAQQQAASAP